MGCITVIARALMQDRQPSHDLIGITMSDEDTVVMEHPADDNSEAAIELLIVAENPTLEDSVVHPESRRQRQQPPLDTCCGHSSSDGPRIHGP